MDRRQIATRLVLDALNIELDLSSFDKRLVLQKTIYLAQAAGIHLGYQYSWYLRGPYSRGLTADAFVMKDELDSGLMEQGAWHLDPESRKRLASIESLLSGVGGEDSRELARWLELLASVHFLIDTRQIDLEKDRVDAIKERLEAFNKNYTNDEIRRAIDELVATSLVARGG